MRPVPTALCLAATLVLPVAGPAPASAGVGDTPLPTFADGKGAIVVYTASGVIKNNNLGTAFICTNVDAVPVDIGVEVFDETGVLRNAVAAGDGAMLNVPPGATVTVATDRMAVLTHNQILALNAAGTGANDLRNGAGRVVATGDRVGCVALVVDPLHTIQDPALCPTCQPPSLATLVLSPATTTSASTTTSTSTTIGGSSTTSTSTPSTSSTSSTTYVTTTTTTTAGSTSSTTSSSVGSTSSTTSTTVGATTTITTTTLATPSTSTTTSVSTTTSTTVQPTTTSTTQPTGGCGNEPVGPTFLSLDCRLAALIAEVAGETGLGALEPKLLDQLRKARMHKEKAESLCGQASKRRTRHALRPAINKIVQFVATLHSHKARTIPQTVKDALRTTADAIRLDLQALRRAVQCPQDVPPA